MYYFRKVKVLVHVRNDNYQDNPLLNIFKIKKCLLKRPVALSK